MTWFLRLGQDTFHSSQRSQNRRKATAAPLDISQRQLSHHQTFGPRSSNNAGRNSVLIRSLEDFSDIGRHHGEQRAGLRSCGVPGLSTVTLVFLNTAASVTVLRVGYLGRNVIAALPSLGQ